LITQHLCLCRNYGQGKKAALISGLATLLLKIFLVSWCCVKIAGKFGKDFIKQNVMMSLAGYSAVF
jgi:hypothetical protein